MNRALRILLVIVIAAEVGFGLLYATRTPLWEAPDEPAQFNYVRHVAETGTLPELRQGDYDQALLEKLKAEKFPPGEPVDSIRYESYQPPLYYLLAAPFYLAARASGGDPALALRILDVALGALLLLLAYAVLQLAFAWDRRLALAGTAFIATVPMHIAMSAAVNADSLAEIILALLLIVSLRRALIGGADGRFILTSGILYGLALLTSTKIYPGAILPLLAELIYRFRCRRSSQASWLAQSARVLLPLFAISLVLSAWWFVRNAALYGGLDILGWGRHDVVVQGQLTTAQAVAQDGLKSVVAGFFVTTFKSFWAQFGWMGVLVNDRIYVALFLLTAVAALGAFLWVWRMLREKRVALGVTWPVWLVMSAWLAVVLLAHVYYNLRYVQDQGRYLFPALIPIAGFFVVGLAELLDRRHWRTGFALLYLGMVGLDYVSLFWYIIPQLRA